MLKTARERLESMLVVCGTGHRPDKLGGEYDLKGPVTKAIATEVFKILDRISPTVIMSGMALGFDMILAVCAIKRNIDLYAAVPFAGQEKKWPKSSQDLYNTLLRKASHVEIVSDGEYAPWKMQHRNCFMVDNSDKIIACWDGSKGGTGNCVGYALKWPAKELIRIDPKKLAKVV